MRDPRATKRIPRRSALRNGSRSNKGEMKALANKAVEPSGATRDAGAKA